MRNLLRTPSFFVWGPSFLRATALPALLGRLDAWQDDFMAHCKAHGKRL
jgi:hypothetical protein